MKQIYISLKRLLPIWYSYTSFVQSRTSDKRSGLPLNMDDWRSRLFTNFITYLLPSCLIALVPGVYMSMVYGYVTIGIADILAVVLTAAISLAPWFSQYIKKILVIFIFYCLSIVLLIELSIVGPGFVYLLTLSVVITITCKIRLAYASVAMNLLVCAACALIIHFQLWDTQLAKDYTLGVWITVCSNLVFLSFIIVLLIGKTIQGLEKTIQKEFSLKNALYKVNLEQCQTNQMLKESEGHYKSLFFQSPTPMWVLDMETFGFLQVNQAALLKYGYTEKEFLQMNIIDVKYDTDADNVHSDMDRTLQTGVPQKIFTRHLKKDGTMFHVEVIFNAISFDGRPATLAMSNDLTERMEYIESIRKQNEKLKRIAWIQCHEVRAPLATILGLADLYEPGLPSNQVAEIMGGISESAGKLDTVIRETVAKSDC